MSWMEIARLVVFLWPYIEKILEGIKDAKERDETANAVTNVQAKILDGRIKISKPEDVIAALWEPLKLVA